MQMGLYAKLWVTGAAVGCGGEISLTCLDVLGRDSVIDIGYLLTLAKMRK